MIFWGLTHDALTVRVSNAVKIGYGIVGNFQDERSQTHLWSQLLDPPIVGSTWLLCPPASPCGEMQAWLLDAGVEFYFGIFWSRFFHCLSPSPALWEWSVNQGKKMYKWAEDDMYALFPKAYVCKINTGSSVSTSAHKKLSFLMQVLLCNKYCFFRFNFRKKNNQIFLQYVKCLF